MLAQTPDSSSLDSQYECFPSCSSSARQLICIFFPPFFRFFNPPTDTLLLRNWKQYKLEGVCTFLHCLACALFQTSYESGIFSRMFVFTTRDNEQAPKLGRRVFTTEVTGTLRQRRLKMIILPPLYRLNISTLFTSS